MDLNSNLTNLELKRETALLEIVLFLENEPLNIKSLSRITGLSGDIVKKCLLFLKDRYNDDACGIELVEIAEGFMLYPKKAYWNFLKQKYGKKSLGKLSRAALETLSIIAYSQPVTRSEIESIRGVSPDAMVRLLLDKKLIKEVGKKDAPGRPVQYGTTQEFLKMFRLKSIADLPKLNEDDENRFRDD